MIWICKPFKQLSVTQLYDALKLRSDVFVVEQECIYPDLDNKDKHEGSLHLLGYDNHQIIAYARLLPATVSYDNASFGRLATAQNMRLKGLGKKLLSEVLKRCEEHWPGQSIDIGAQTYLFNFYSSAGFESISAAYLEDGIEHIDMRLSK